MPYPLVALPAVGFHHQLGLKGTFEALAAALVCLCTENTEPSVFRRAVPVQHPDCW